MDDLITLNLVEDHKVKHRYAFELDALRLFPECAGVIEEALAVWMLRQSKRRRVFVQFRGLTHIVGPATSIQYA